MRFLSSGLLLNVVILFIAIIGCRGKVGLTSNEFEAAKLALKELNKLASVTEAGLNHQEYQTRLLNAKVEIDNQLHDIPSSQVKTYLQESLQAYVDAKEFWDLALQRQGEYRYFYLSDAELAKYSKYGFGGKDRKEPRLVGDEMVSIFWMYGKSKASYAEELLLK